MLTSGDNEKFMIDQKTGQITTLWDFNRDVTTEATADAAGNCATANECVVTVTATDASGESVSTNATVNIALTNVNEKPVFVTDGTGPPAASSPMTISSPENREALFDTALTAPSPPQVGVTYRANDPEGQNVTYHLMGPDAAMFQLNFRLASFPSGRKRITRCRRTRTGTTCTR